MRLAALCLLLCTHYGTGVMAQVLPPTNGHYINSIGIQLRQVEAGSFDMGTGQAPLPDSVAGKPHRGAGDHDEKPLHRVTITRPFYMGVHEVTNAQYERFDPEHRRLRGKLGFSVDDSEAVVFVSWHEATRFCEWLSRIEGLPYRLPTEAEWEYACRAGTTNAYHTGDTLPVDYRTNQKTEWEPTPMPLHVGHAPPNPWGLHEMHGNVEEWCHDWYGPYPSEPQIDPVGYAHGDFKVTRGGSHSTEVYYLRSANRSGTLPEDKHWLIGFRVVIGEMPRTSPLPPSQGPLWARDVGRSEHDWSDGPDPSAPHFAGPRRFVNIPADPDTPMFTHNHCPAVVACPNGDLLAIWYSCVEERGRELSILASRLRRGTNQWEPASVFWDAPDRNDHASALWFDGDKTIYHFNGLSTDATWGKLALIMRTSTDNGATWSSARIINPEHGLRNMPIESVFRTRAGAIVLPCDAVTAGEGGTAIHISRDGGQTWHDPGAGRPAPTFDEGTSGAWIAGIHAGVVELLDGSLMALGRGNNINGCMPKSISRDMGKTWTYTASEFPPIGGGQRLALLRLKEGPLFFASFASNLTITDETGRPRDVSGLFAALSYDEGETWPVKRLISDDGPGRPVEAMDGHVFTMSAATAEPKGYLSVCQAPDGVVHLISSRQHYSFNLAWLQTSPPAAPEECRPPTVRDLAQKGPLPTLLDCSALPTEAGQHWSFTGSGVEAEDVASIEPPGALTIDTGPGQRCRWADDAPEGFGSADGDTGFTAEIRLQVTKSTLATRGIDFEAYLGDGTALGRRYFLTITPTGVYWYDGGFEALAEGLDNHTAMHTYRIAAREDGVAQLYRDGEVLAVKRPAFSVDGMLKPRGPYLQWGDGAGAAEADARVDHVSYDLSGAYQPGP